MAEEKKLKHGEKIVVRVVPEALVPDFKGPYLMEGIKVPKTMEVSTPEVKDEPYKGLVGIDHRNLE